MQRSSHARCAAAALACMLFALGASTGCSERAGRPPATPAIQGQGVFVAADGSRIEAVYLADDTVRLGFSDGSRVVLPRAVSASGARYADASHEWWEHQGEASYRVDGATVFRGALER